MPYSRHRPSADLAPLVESLWVQEAPVAETPAIPTTVLPIGRAELLVHFGDPFEHWEGGRFARVPACYVMGQRTRPLQVRAAGATGIVLVSLRPWAGQALFGLPLAPVEDRCLDLEALVGRSTAIRLRDRVRDAAGTAERVAVVEAFLRVVRGDRMPDPLVREAVTRINDRWGRVRIDMLAGELGLSRRQLQRRFTSAVGASPKRFARIVRAQKALGLLRQGAGSLDVTFRCGYADQSHLIHELTEVAGRTAGALASPATETPLMKAFNARGVSHFYNTVYL